MSEIRPILYLISSCIISIVLIPIGVVYNIGKSIYECYRTGIWFGIFKFLAYWLFFVYQIWNVIKYLFYHISVSNDLFWNASSGEMIEDVVTTRENTLFGRGDVTVSAATGDIQAKGVFTKSGHRFNRFLDKAFSKNHAIEAYKKWLRNTQPY